MAQAALPTAGHMPFLGRRLRVVDRDWLKFIGWFWVALAANSVVSGILLLSRTSGDDSALTSLPLDYSWIHMVYIRALVTEGCLCYNEGIWAAGATSWAWVFANAPFYLVGHMWLGIEEAYVIKFVGVSFGALATLFVFLLVRRLTGNVWVSIAIAAATVLEPTFAYHRVSGMEAPIVVASVLGATLALLTDRRRLAGMALLVAFWSRPEAALFVAMALTTVGILWVMKNKNLTREGFGELLLVPFSDNVPGQMAKARTGLGKLYEERSMLWVIIPPLAGGLAWVAYNYLVNGTIYPNTYLAKHDYTLSYFPLGNISNVYHWGMAYGNPWLSGWILPITVAAYLLGSGLMYRRGGGVLLPLILFPLVLVYAVGQAARYDEAPMTFWTRRYVDPVMPIIIMLVALGGYALATTITRNTFREFKRPAARAGFLLPFYGLFIAGAIGSLIGGADTWRKMYDDYSWNARNINEVDVAAGKWINANTSPDQSVLVFDAGAIRYFGDRYTYDVVGLNAHELIGREHIDVVITEQPEVLAIFSTPVYEQMPNATKHIEFAADPNTILGFDRIGIYSLDWSPELFAPPDLFREVSVDGEIIDTLHLTDRAAEETHEYFISFVSYAPRAVGDLGGLTVIDRGISHSGAVTERFIMQAEPESDLTLVLRHSTTLAVLAQPEVFVNGVSVGFLPIEMSEKTFQETAFTIPASFIGSETVEIRVEWNTPTTQFRWWAVASS